MAKNLSMRIKESIDEIILTTKDTVETFNYEVNYFVENRYLFLNELLRRIDIKNVDLTIKQACYIDLGKGDCEYDYRFSDEDYSKHAKDPTLDSPEEVEHNAWYTWIDRKEKELGQLVAVLKKEFRVKSERTSEKEKLSDDFISVGFEVNEYSYTSQVLENLYHLFINRGFIDISTKLDTFLSCFDSKNQLNKPPRIKWKKSNNLFYYLLIQMNLTNDDIYIKKLIEGELFVTKQNKIFNKDCRTKVSHVKENVVKGSDLIDSILIKSKVIK